MACPCKYKSVSVVGLGYIGLPTSAIFALNGVFVVGVDINRHTIDVINSGHVHILEPGLEAVVSNAVRNKLLIATNEPRPSDAFIIAVPTPFKDDHKPDISYVKAASEAIAPVLCKGNLVILESTSPVGTTEQLSEWLAFARPDLTFPHNHGESSDIRIAYCPERVLPGHVLKELVENDRIIGGITPKCSDFVAQLYKIFVKGECVLTNARTAEMCKLTENSFRDVNIAFANEISMISHKFSINVWDVINLANRHPRVNILQPGCGVGGHCIAVDPWFLVDKAPEEARLIRMARLVNDDKPFWVIAQIDKAVQSELNKGLASDDLCIACLGLSFKADIDDLRESPAVQITSLLGQKYKGMVYAVEPNIKELPDDLIRLGVQLVTLEKALSSAQIVVLLVDHSPFRSIKPDLSDIQLIDTKGLWI